MFKLLFNTTFGVALGFFTGAIAWVVFGSCTVGADMSKFTCTKQQVVKESYPQVFECTQWSRKDAQNNTD